MLAIVSLLYNFSEGSSPYDVEGIYARWVVKKTLSNLEQGSPRKDRSYLFDGEDDL